MTTCDFWLARKGFRLFWTWKVRHGQPGRPAGSKEIRQLIRKMSRENPLWGAPRIHGELLKLGIDIGETSVGKYIVRSRKPPSQTWRTFLENHVKNMVSTSSLCRRSGFRSCTCSWFWLTTAGGSCISTSPPILRPSGPRSNSGRRLREAAFPFEQIPRYLLRDRDRIYGGEFPEDVKAMGIQEVLSAPRSPWQRAYVERVIGTIRRECLDHVIVLNEASLYRHVKSFLAYYHESRTHLSLAKDTPEPRPVHPPPHAAVVAIPQVGGLHHRYERRAA